MFSRLEDLVPVFYLMELDLVCMKGSVVSSSRFWGVYGFCMSLSSLFSFSSVKHVHFRSHMEVALSAYPYCHQPPTCPCTLCQCFHSLTLPCTAGWSLLSQDLCGSFLGYQPCPQHHRDFYGLPSAPWAHPLCCRACVHLFQLTRSSFYVLEIVCIRFGSLGSPSMLQGLCVLLSSLNLLFAPQGLCVLQSFVCRASLDTLASPLHQGTSVGFCWFPEPAVLSGP